MNGPLWISKHFSRNEQNKWSNLFIIFANEHAFSTQLFYLGRVVYLEPQSTCIIIHFDNWIHPLKSMSTMYNASCPA